MPYRSRTSLSDFIPVLHIDELPATGSKAVQCNGQSILICRDGDTFYAIENRCSHQFSPLEGGRIRAHHIACPKHGLRFDLRTGKPRGELTSKSIQVYPVRIVEGRIEIVCDAPPDDGTHTPSSLANRAWKA